MFTYLLTLFLHSLHPGLRTCSNLEYLWIARVILSTVCHFSQLVLSTYTFLLYQFLSSYQTFVIFSSFVIYSFFAHPINAPAVHTTNMTVAPVLSSERSLCQYTFPTHQSSMAIVPIWCGGFLEEQTDSFKRQPIEYYKCLAFFDEESVHFLWILWNIGKDCLIPLAAFLASKFSLFCEA